MNFPVQVLSLHALLKEQSSQDGSRRMHFSHRRRTTSSEAKKIRFDSIIEKQFENMFIPFGEGGNVGICSVTGEEVEADSLIQLEYHPCKKASAS